MSLVAARPVPAPLPVAAPATLTAATPVPSTPSITPATARPTCACAHLHPHKSCLSYLVSSFGRSFYLAYGIRAGITLVLHMIKLARTRPRALLEIDQLVGAHGLPIDAVRMGLFFGGFTGIYNGMRCVLARWTGRDNKFTVMLSGALAGLSLGFHPQDSHRTLALYILARVGQCWYNRAKVAGKWHLWGSDWPHGDSLLFSICSAQVMYAYAMRPDTLPPAYFKFIVDTGPIPAKVLDAVRANNRGLALDMDSLRGVYNKIAPAGAKSAEAILGELAVKAYGPGAPANRPPMIPCSILHPANPHCSHQWAETWMNAAKRTLPLYTTITFVPMVVLRFWAVVRHPVDSLLRGGFSVARSTSFLASFVSIYMFIICMQRRTFVKDHRSIYWIAGFISSWTILLEQKSRRSELALYVLPRTVDALLMTLQDRRLLASNPRAEKALFCLGMSALMYYREYHPDSMSPLLRRLLNFFVPSYRSLPKESHAHAPGADLAHGVKTPAATVAGGGGSGVDSAPPSMLRADSDGLSCASIEGVIPLPQAGISLSREQSASFNTVPSAAASSGGFAAHIPSFVTNSVAPLASSLSGASNGNAAGASSAGRGPTRAVAASYGNLFARDVSPSLDSSPLQRSSGSGDSDSQESPPEQVVEVLVVPAGLPSVPLPSASTSNGKTLSPLEPSPQPVEEQEAATATSVAVPSAAASGSDETSSSTSASHANGHSNGGSGRKKKGQQRK